MLWLLPAEGGEARMPNHDGRCPEREHLGIRMIEAATAVYRLRAEAEATSDKDRAEQLQNLAAARKQQRLANREYHAHIAQHGCKRSGAAE